MGGWVTPYVKTMDNVAFMRSVAPGSVRLVVTSPPYNIGKAYEGKAGLDEYLDGQGRVLEEVLRVLSDDGSVCWQVGNYVSNGHIVPLDVLLYPIFAGMGLVLRNRIIWHFGHGLHCRHRLSGRYETINWWTRNGPYVWNLDPIRVPSKYPGKRYYKGPRKGELAGNPKGKNPSDFWLCDPDEYTFSPGGELDRGCWNIPNVKHNHPEKEPDHPCQFPVELAERLVLALSNEGDAVLDPYMGVGSTVVAAAKQHRYGLGCDTERRYVAVARKRLKALEEGVLRTRPIGRPIYGEGR